jgi:hypothetical protein
MSPDGISSQQGQRGGARCEGEGEGMGLVRYMQEAKEGRRAETGEDAVCERVSEVSSGRVGVYVCVCVCECACVRT